MSQTLWGVIIGALAAIVGGLISELFKYKLERKMFLFDKRAKTYETI